MFWGVEHGNFSIFEKWKNDDVGMLLVGADDLKMLFKCIWNDPDDSMVPKMKNPKFMKNTRSSHAPSKAVTHGHLAWYMILFGCGTK